MNQRETIFVILGLSLLLIFAQELNAQMASEAVHEDTIKAIQELEKKANDKNMPIEYRRRYQNEAEDIRNIDRVATKLEALKKALKEGKIDKTEFDTQIIIMSIEQLSHEIRMLREELSIDLQSLKK